MTTPAIIENGLPDDGWRPIETAPRDGSTFIAWRGGVIFTRWDDDRYARKPMPFWGGNDAWRGKRFQRENNPTHWMPLPEPPKGQP